MIGGVFDFITPDQERDIQTPHEHEHSEYNKPLWLIWRMEHASNGVPYFPVLDTVCDSVESARYHVGMAMEESSRSSTTIKVYVERIPANHRFGSSLPELQQRAHLALWRKREELAEGHL